MLGTPADKIKALVEPLLEGKDLFVVDVEIKSGIDQPEVWVLLDKEQADLGIAECSAVSRELSLLMEAHELFDGKYRLNVSSPGTSKPLV
ncbi:hypothetical protein RZS08_19815, partial [Arthrospira platensis SPKY1]|nr:hypothetical protein [Arthrospira platensis SPKY1]